MILKTILAYIATKAVAKYESKTYGLIQLAQNNLKKFLFGIICIMLGIFSASLTFLFGALTLFLMLANLSQYQLAAIWTSGTLAIISIILIFSGFSFFKRK